MRNKIIELAKLATQVEPNHQQKRLWQRQVNDYAQQFLETEEERPCYVETEDKGKGLLEYPIQEDPRSMEDLLEILKVNVDTPGLDPTSGGHMAYIPGGGMYPSALGDYLAAVTNRYSGVFYSNPGAIRMENMLVRWLCDIMGFPKTALGNLTSGGSIANLIAIVTARDRQQIRSKAVEKAVIYLTHQAHHSVQKAIRIAGLDDAQLSYIDTDERFRLDIHHLQAQITADKKAGLRPFLVIAAAGTTDVGAIDPLNEVAAIAEKENLWFHVDAAYGGAFILTEEIKPAYQGIERADSITIDPHKGLFIPYGSGAVLIKDVEALKKSHYYFANYMQDALMDDAEPSPADLSPELSKHFRGLRMWLPLQLYGVAPFRAALSEKIWLCRYFYEEVQKIGFEVGPYPELSVTIYRYVPQTGDANDFNAALVRAMRADGSVYLTSTTIEGIHWLRIAILHFRTHLREIDLCLRLLKEKVAILATDLKESRHLQHKGSSLNR
ncbi:MAG: aminotransferase class V-fold PLP-dependent enzyme [Bacteroidota bacterium]